MSAGHIEVPRTAPPELAADLVLYGGVVVTMDRMERRAEAIAIRDGRVLALGSSREMLTLAGPATRLLDLAGRAALPGFIETHNHAMHVGGKQRWSVDAGTPPNDTIDDILQRFVEKVRTTPQTEWIRGTGYDDTLLREMRHPTRWDLDRVASGHPVYLTHVSGHLSVANTAALRIAGVTRETPNPAGGRIFRDARGEPTGVLAERAAQELVSRHLPSIGAEEMVEALAIASREYLAAGVTSVHDAGIGLMGGAAEITAYRTAVERGRFRQRCYGFLTEAVLPELGSGILNPVAAAIPGLGDDRFRLGAVKMWADGSIQGLTGALAEPYACAPHTHGVAIYTPEELTTRVRALHEAGWQIAIHGNGDAAIQEIIEAYAHTLAGRSDRDRRYRIEHCQMVRDDQLARMADLGILPSFFVKHVYYWGDRHRDIFIGPERARRISPLRSAQQRGIPFGLHSDCPVTPIPPLEGIWAAVNRITRRGETLGAEQRVDVTTALRAYTSDAAYLSFEEEIKGTLEPAKMGDLAVLSADPTAVPPEQLKDILVDATVISGEVVWERT